MNNLKKKPNYFFKHEYHFNKCVCKIFNLNSSSLIENVKGGIVKKYLNIVHIVFLLNKKK